MVTDAQAVAASWTAGAACTSTAPYARRLLLEAMRRGITVVIEWQPRERLAAEDAASRVAAASAAHACPPAEWVRERVNTLLGRACDAEIFADPGARLLPDVPCGAQRPCRDAALGDGMTPALWMAVRAGWAYPPFALVRPLVTMLALLPQPPRALCLLPDTPYVRCALRSWSVHAPPPHLLAPPDFARHLRGSVQLALFAPPTPRQTR